MTRDAPVLVGVDGSEHSLAAADLAADEAARRGLPLEIVHAYTVPVLSRPVGLPPGVPPAAPPDVVDGPWRERAEQLLHETAQRARQAHPDLPVITRLHDGYPAEALTAASRQASLAVVGHRGVGGFVGMLVGSVGVQLAQHAACPLVIVRGDAASGGPVVVGVDGSQAARQAAEFAAASARAYGAPLVVLYAQPPDPGWSPEQVQAGDPPPQPPAEVTETIDALRQAHPELAVQPQTPRDVTAPEALITASRNARLVVVGARGLGGFQGLLLGSVSHALIHHARCPVAVVGPGARD